MALLSPFVSVGPAALTGELLWHWALPFGHVAGEPVEQQSALGAHLSPGCLAVLCSTATERESKCSEEMRTSARSSSFKDTGSAPSCNFPSGEAFEVVKWSKKKKNQPRKTRQLCSKLSHTGRNKILISDQKILWLCFLVGFYISSAGVETTGWGCTSSTLRHYQA